MNFDACIFDLDGTLLDSLYIWKEIDEKFLAKRGLEVPDDYGRIISTMGFKNCAEYTKKRFELPESTESIIAEWNEMAIDIYAYEVELKPFAVQYLASLKHSGARLGIATANHKACFMPALERTGIVKYFEPDAIISIDMVTTDKSSSEIYLSAANALNRRPSECIVFEDVLTAAEVARNAGFNVIGVLNDEWSESFTKMDAVCNRTIRSFKELL